MKNKSSHIVLPDETPLGNDLALNLLTRMQKKIIKMHYIKNVLHGVALLKHDHIHVSV